MTDGDRRRLSRSRSPGGRSPSRLRPGARQHLRDALHRRQRPARHPRQPRGGPPRASCRAPSWAASTTATRSRSSTWSTPRTGWTPPCSSTACGSTSTPARSSSTGACWTCATACLPAAPCSRTPRADAPAWRRCASRAWPTAGICALRVTVTPENHDAQIVVESGIDGDRRNLERLPVYPDRHRSSTPEMRWEKWALAKHLDEIARSAPADALYLQMRTHRHRHQLGYARVDHLRPPRRSPRRPAAQRARSTERTVHGGGRETVRMEKLVAICTSRDADASGAAARPRAGRPWPRTATAGFDARSLAASRAVWEQLWDACDCEVDGDRAATRALRFGLYHLLIAANPDDPTVNIGAKSLSGEGYRGHVFWDTEIFMLPFFIYTQPDTARALLRYRHHTLDGARANSREYGTARRPLRLGVGRHRPRGMPEVHRRRGQPVLDPRGGGPRLRRRRLRDPRATSRPPATATSCSTTAPRSCSRPAGSGSTGSQPSPDGRLRAPAGDGPGRVPLPRRQQRLHQPPGAVAPDRSVGPLRRAARPATPTRWPPSRRRSGSSPTRCDRWREVAERIVDRRDRRPGVIEQFDGYFERDDIPITEWDDNDMPRYPQGYHHFNCEDDQAAQAARRRHAQLPAARRVQRRGEAGELRVLRGADAAQVVAEPADPRDHGIEVGDTTRARPVLRPLGPGRPGRQPGQHRRRHAHRLRRRDLADPGQRVRRPARAGRAHDRSTPGCPPTGRASASGSAGAAAPSTSRSTTATSNCCSAATPAAPRRYWSAAGR